MAEMLSLLPRRRASLTRADAADRPSDVFRCSATMATACGCAKGRLRCSAGGGGRTVCTTGPEGRSSGALSVPSTDHEGWAIKAERVRRLVYIRVHLSRGCSPCGRPAKEGGAFVCSAGGAVMKKKKTRSVQYALRWRPVGNRWRLVGNRWRLVCNGV